jgi:hypothetical protein
LLLKQHSHVILTLNVCISCLDVQIQFLNKLRSAATPGAHRRQLEILYPTSLSILVNINAPKLVVPVSSNTADGALYLDAGKFKMAAVKPSKTSSSRWGIDLSDIQVKFLREVGMTSSSPETTGNGLTIVYPFHIAVNGISTESIEIPLESMLPSMNPSVLMDKSKDTLAREVVIAIGKIRLNLVDAEGN